MPINIDLTAVIFGLLWAWVIALTILLIQTNLHYRRLTKNITKKDLKIALSEILSQLDLSRKQLEGLGAHVKKLELKNLDFIQKSGIVRFNPFPQTGGDQSFCLALLDAKNNGFVLSSLHSRDHTRLYAKVIKNGESAGHELSKEERQAIKNAQ